MSNIGPVGKVMFRRKEQEDLQSPKCQEEETNMHLTQYRGADSDDIFKTTMERVDRWLKQSPKQMAIAIKELIVAFREAREPIWTNIDHEEILEIAKAQWFLSNPTIMWGFLHKSWDKVMEKHLKRSRKSSTR